jgi:hypothetical protein
LELYRRFHRGGRGRRAEQLGVHPPGRDTEPQVLSGQASPECRASFFFDLLIGKKRPALVHPRPGSGRHMRTVGERGAEEVAKFPDH